MPPQLFLVVTFIAVVSLVVVYGRKDFRRDVESGPRRWLYPLDLLRGYAEFLDLVIAHVGDTLSVYDVALAGDVAFEKGWTTTESWREID